MQHVERIACRMQSAQPLAPVRIEIHVPVTEVAAPYMISERRSDASPDAEAAVVLGRILSVTALENVRIVRYRRPIAVVAIPPVHSQIRHETASGRIPKKLDLRKQRALVAETVVVEHISHTERDFSP